MFLQFNLIDHSLKNQLEDEAPLKYNIQLGGEGN